MIFILVFIIVRYIPNYIFNKQKNGQHITNNNYYVRMFIDTKRDSHTFVWKSLEYAPLISTFMIQDIWEYIFYCILLSKAAFKSPTASGI